MQIIAADDLCPKIGHAVTVAVEGYDKMDAKLRGRMKILIVNPYGSLPSEGWREYRSWMLAKALERAGHTVYWLLSDFEHRSKTKRKESNRMLELDKNIRVIIVQSGRYKRNISLQRIVYERRFSINVLKLLKSNHLIPDLVIIAEPALFYGKPIMRFCMNRSISVVVDIVDLWPEAFALLLPGILRKISKLVFAPLYLSRWLFLRKASAILAVSKDYEIVGKKANPQVPSFTAYLGVDIQLFDTETQDSGYISNFNALLALKKKNKETWLVFAGTFGEGYDLFTVFKTARMISKRGVPIRFFFAGQGPFDCQVKQMAKELPESVVFLGKVPSNDLPQIYKYCDIGIACYDNYSPVAMPVKFYDYVAAGLAVITSLKREVGRIITEYEIGLIYDAGSAVSLFDSILRLYYDPSLLGRMKSNALSIRHRFNSVFQHDQAAAFIDSVFASENPHNLIL